MVPADIGIKIEPSFTTFNQKISNITNIDTIMLKNKCPAIVVNPEWYDQILLMKMQRNSQYKAILPIDIYGNNFGIQKLLNMPSLASAEGFEIGLANGPVAQIINEMKSVHDLLKMSKAKYLVRWCINNKYGEKYVNNCLEAIKKYELSPDMIRITNSDGINVNDIRKKLGKMKMTIKIDSKVNDIKKWPNVLYNVKIEEL